MDRNTLYGVGGMLVGGVLAAIGLLQISVLARVLVLVGGVIGFTSYKIYKGDIVL